MSIYVKYYKVYDHQTGKEYYFKKLSKPTQAQLLYYFNNELNQYNMYPGRLEITRIKFEDVPL